LTAPISGYRRYRVKNPDITRDIGEQYQDRRISGLENAYIIPDVFSISGYTDIVYFLISGPISAARAPPAALTTGTALSVLHA
jgi:hypothetical protein